MKPTVAAIWVIPYLAAVAIALHLSIGFPPSAVPYLAFLACAAAVGGFGVFFTEVSRSAIQRHPIQTSLYGAILSSVILSAITIFLLVITLSISGLIVYEGEAFGWAVVVLFGLVIQFLLATLVSSLISIPCAYAFTLTRTEQAAARQLDPAPGRKAFSDFGS